MGILTWAYRIYGRMQRRAEFECLCRRHGLALNWRRDGDAGDILTDIFQQRVYADYFPFQEAAVVLDIGAHRGYFLLFCARQLDAQAKLFAVEPHPQNFADLQQVLREHNIPSVQALQAGVSDCSASATLHQSRSPNHSLFAGHAAALGQSQWGSCSVETLTLEVLLDRLQLTQVDFLKMDAEGAEYPALLSADAATLRRCKVISLEFHDVKTKGCTGLALVRHLEACGFRIVKFAHGSTVIDNNYGYLVGVRADD